MSTDVQDIPEYLREQFRRLAGVEVIDISVKSYPDEVNYIVLVDEVDIPAAATTGNHLDEELSKSGVKSFVIVRKAPTNTPQPELSASMRTGVREPRVTDLTRLISARSRVSIAQPSLAYVRDLKANLSAITAPRHHLVFGRRGAGKTALLVEARRQVGEEGADSCWVNVQTLRHESLERVLLYVLEELITTVVSSRRSVRPESIVAVDASKLFEDIRSLLSKANAVGKTEVTALIPRVQRTLSRYLEIEDLRIYLFLDDFYYLSRAEQPLLLDLLHGAVRDTNVWMKIASIRHLTRWYQSSPPIGLQTIHDADLIDLDVTLQDPRRAQDFLESVLLQYSRRVGISALKRVFSGDALDRLVLASGAVPRDYLVLASSAIAKAQQRQNARLVGVQDVNQAAGDAASVKLQELEEDMASNIGTAERTLAALQRLRDFCLEEESFTYFLVGYRDKENEAVAYGLLTELMDVRLIHLLDSGVSDAHAAGQRSEAFMMDLSQFSGSRLKQRINVLDFSGGRMIARQTRTSAARRTGDTPRQVIAILRGAPTFKLARLRDLAAASVRENEVAP